MITEQDRKAIAEILRDNITFSPQIGDYVIHGAIEKICDWHLKLRDTETIELIREHCYNYAILDALEILKPEINNEVWLKVMKLYKIETDSEKTTNQQPHEIR